MILSRFMCGCWECNHSTDRTSINVTSDYFFLFFFLFGNVMSFPDLPIPTQIVPFFFTPPTGQLASYPAIASQPAKTAEVWSKQFRNIHMHPPIDLDHGITRTAVIFLTTLTYSYQSTTTTSTTYAPSISKYYLLSPTTRARRGKRLTQYVPS